MVTPPCTHRHTNCAHARAQRRCGCGVCDNETILGGAHLDCVISSPWKQSTALKWDCFAPSQLQHDVIQYNSSKISGEKKQNDIWWHLKVQRAAISLKYAHSCGPEVCLQLMFVYTYELPKIEKLVPFHLSFIFWEEESFSGREKIDNQLPVL